MLHVNSVKWEDGSSFGGSQDSLDVSDYVKSREEISSDIYRAKIRLRRYLISCCLLYRVTGISVFHSLLYRRLTAQRWTVVFIFGRCLQEA
jgi:hypothetical protein